MKGIARVGDKVEGTYPVPGNNPHPVTGFITLGSSKVFADGRSVARVGDKGNHPEGVITLTMGSSKVFVDNKPIARLGDFADVGPGPGQVTTGSQKITAG